MYSSIHRTVKELALEVPGATRVFERAGIDYCCGGGRSLEDACAAAHIDSEALIETLRALESNAAAPLVDRDFREYSLEKLIDHIVATHHVFTATELSRLEPLLAKVQAKHGDTHGELAALGQAFAKLRDDLLPHMLKEERVLFPYVTSMERAHAEGRPLVPPPFMTVANPIRMMMLEHDVAGDILRDIRSATSDFTVPQDACTSFRALYDGLEDLERDLHQHIHLENNLLFPRAAEMEAAYLPAR